MSQGNNRVPEVTIGLPVYNGETHVAQAIDSLLAQSFTDLQLLISDNASSDGTEQICREYARRDSRVRYVRHSRNLGATFNWNFVAVENRSPFFKWASANDVTPPVMLERSLEALRQHSDIILCYGRTILIDERDSVIGTKDDDPEILDSQPSVRFRRVLDELVANNAQSGLIRTSALRRTRMERDYVDGDMVLMAELALLGGFRKLDDVLLYRRMSLGSATRFLSDVERQDFLTPNAVRRAPVMRRHIDRLISVCRSPIDWREKRRTLDFVLRSIYWDRRNIARDLASAFSLAASGNPNESR